MTHVEKISSDNTTKLDRALLHAITENIVTVLELIVIMFCGLTWFPKIA